MQELCGWLQTSKQAAYALLGRARRQLRRCLRLRLGEEPGHAV